MKKITVALAAAALLTGVAGFTAMRAASVDWAGAQRSVDWAGAQSNSVDWALPSPDAPSPTPELDHGVDRGTPSLDARLRRDDCHPGGGRDRCVRSPRGPPSRAELGRGAARRGQPRLDQQAQAVGPFQLSVAGMIHIASIPLVGPVGAIVVAVLPVLLDRNNTVKRVFNASQRVLLVIAGSAPTPRQEAGSWA